MNKEEIREYLKKVHLQMAEHYFSTAEFERWVSATYRVHLDMLEKNINKECVSDGQER